MSKKKSTYLRPELRVMNIQAISLLDGYTVNPNDPPEVDDVELDADSWTFDRTQKNDKTNRVWE